MAKAKSSGESSDREKKWDKVFNALLKLSQNLQKDRHVLEDRIKYLLGVICKMKMEQKVESAKSELLLGLKEREALNYKHRYEDVDDELADFREWFDYLSQNCSKPKDLSDLVSSKEKSPRNKPLQNELKRLKTEIEKCKFEKNSEISALLAEKNFVWNQLRKMESDFEKKFRKKCDEVAHANEKVQVLVNRAEELQSSNEKLRIEFAKMESDSVQKNEEISRLLEEIALLKSISGSTTPALHRCRAELVASQIGRKTSNIDERVVTVKKESDSTNGFVKMPHTKQVARKSTGGKAPRKYLIAKESSRSKRKAADVITIVDSPKLFTSSFKVPKLKSSSPQVVRTHSAASTVCSFGKSVVYK